MKREKEPTDNIWITILLVTALLMASVTYLVNS